MIKLNPEYTEYRMKYRELNSNEENTELLIDITDNLSYLDTYNKEVSTLIFNNLKDNINYPTSHLKELNEFVEHLSNSDYEDVDDMINNAMEKEHKYFTRQELWEFIDKDLMQLGIDSDYLKLRDYLHFEEQEKEIFKFVSDDISWLSEDITWSWYDKNDYLEDVFKENPKKYINIFLDKLEKSYSKPKDIEPEMNY